MEGLYVDCVSNEILTFLRFEVDSSGIYFIFENQDGDTIDLQDMDMIDLTKL